MDNNSFLNIVRGTRLSNYMGVPATYKQGEHYIYSPDYTYIEVGIKHLEVEGKDGTQHLQKASANQYIRVVSNIEVNVKGAYKVLVEPNPDIFYYGIGQPSYYLHPGSGKQEPAFYMQLRKGLDLSQESLYAVRLYLRT